MRKLTANKTKHLFSIGILLCMGGLAGLSSGCEELEARRMVQQGTAAYNSGEYAKAAEFFDESLTKVELATARHNAGLSHLQLFKPGDLSEANKAHAGKVAEHFKAYLATDPDETADVVRVLTNTWIDSGLFKEAEAYWETELAKAPKNRDVHVMLARIARESGQHDKAIEWHKKRAGIETDPLGKVQAFLSIAKMQYGRLARDGSPTDFERLEVADVGLWALGEAEALMPDNMQIHSLYGSLYELRSLTHGATWGSLADIALTRAHRTRWTELGKARKAKAAAAEADPKAAGTESSKAGK